MINRTVLREKLRAWREKSGWSSEQIGFALGLRYKVDMQRWSIRRFLNGERYPSEGVLEIIQRFIDETPTDAGYHVWYARTILPNSIGSSAGATNSDLIRARSEALEQQREQERRAWLALERKPQRSPFPAGIIPSKEMLDAARRAI